MNRVIKTIIIDDDPVAVRKLSDDLKAFPDVEVIDTAMSAEEAKIKIVCKQPDLLFLDIELPGMSGIEMLREIQPEIRPGMRIIFYSAYDKYLRNAMLAADFDYFLLKPYLPEELNTAIMRLRSRENAATVEHLLQKTVNSDRFSIQTVNGVKILKYDDVLFFEYQEKVRNWQIRTVDSATPCLLRTTVSARDIIAITPSFVQVNQGCIVNWKHISFIENKTLRCKFFMNPTDVEPVITPKFYKKIRELLDAL